MLVAGLLLSVIMSFLTWTVNIGQFRWRWMHDRPVLLSCLVAPLISLAAIYATRNYAEYFGGRFYPGMLVSGVVRLLVYALLMALFFREPYVLHYSVIGLVTLGLVFLVKRSRTRP